MSALRTQNTGSRSEARRHRVFAAFRAPADLLASAEQKARRDGMSLSELVRHALRRELSEAA